MVLPTDLQSPYVIEEFYDIPKAHRRFYRFPVSKRALKDLLSKEKF